MIAVSNIKFFEYNLNISNWHLDERYDAITYWQMLNSNFNVIAKK